MYGFSCLMAFEQNFKSQSYLPQKNLKLTFAQFWRFLSTNIYQKIKTSTYNMVSEVQFCTTERPQSEFEVVSCRPFWKLPYLIFKNDEALRKAGVLAYQFDTPFHTILCFQKSSSLTNFLFKKQGTSESSE